jgi:hypothetical protein
MKKKDIEIDPADLLYLSAFRALVDARKEGYEREGQPLRDTFFEEGFEYNVIDCLIELDDEEFSSFVNLLAELKKTLKKERKRAASRKAAVLQSYETSDCDSYDQFTKLFSSRDKNCSYKDFKRHVVSSMRTILSDAKSEGAEERERCVALRMQRLGFPLRTIIRITGCDPETKEPGK